MIPTCNAYMSQQGFTESLNFRQRGLKQSTVKIVAAIQESSPSIQVVLNRLREA
jgi:hypothetical protein